MSTFERYLTVWVGLCIVLGIGLGHSFQASSRPSEGRRSPSQSAGRNPYLADDHPDAHPHRPWCLVRRHPTLARNFDYSDRQLARETIYDGDLGWVFIGWLFRPMLPEAQIDSYIAGLILLGAAPCTAMVFVWSNLTKGEPHFTLSQVALNDLIMVFAFAPIVGLLLGLSAITVPWETLALSVVLYIVVPVIIAQIIRRNLLSNGGQASLDALLKRLQPVSIMALLATLVLLFAFQGEQILNQPMIIVLLALPILIQTYFIFGFGYVLNRFAGEAHCIAAPSALIGASNFFELAVAAAISLFGFHSGAALATVVGVLIEVPVMLSLVWFVNSTRGWYNTGAAVQGREATAKPQG
jgi:ACR3 family arsenite transporter